MSKARFMALAEAAGIDVNYCAGGKHRRTGDILPYELMLDAPEGKKFAGTDCTCDGSLNGHGTETSPNWGAMCKELQTIIDGGFEDADPEEA